MKETEARFLFFLFDLGAIRVVHCGWLQFGVILVYFYFYCCLKDGCVLIGLKELVY